MSCLTGIRILSSHLRSYFLCRSTKKTSLQPAVCIQGTHRINRSKTQHAPLVKGNPFASISQKLLQGHISAYTPVQEHRQIKEAHFSKKIGLQEPQSNTFHWKTSAVDVTFVVKFSSRPPKEEGSVLGAESEISAVSEAGIAS